MLPIFPKMNIYMIKNEISICFAIGIITQKFTVYKISFGQRHEGTPKL